jgi:dihydroorotate dehydrogenase (fumarate)
MVDLTTTWLGLTLDSPLVVAASPLSDDVEAIATAVAAGAGAVVMHSLFEEQLIEEQMGAHRFLDARTDMDAEARTFLPDVDVFSLGAEPYLAQMERLRQRVDVPIIASLNGTTPGGWTGYARQLEDHGASAIELNLYEIATSAALTGAEIEYLQLAVVESVATLVKLPVTVKLSPFYTSLSEFVRRLGSAGAQGITVFNRYYQPDVDLDALDVDRHLVLSNSSELPLRLHALAILSPATTLSLACSGGVHSGRDAAKAVVCGAHVVQLASALLAHGPGYVETISRELTQWLDEKGYVTCAEARGVLAFNAAPNPHAWERLNYVRMLEGWRPRTSRAGMK